MARLLDPSIDTDRNARAIATESDRVNDRHSAIVAFDMLIETKRKGARQTTPTKIN